VNTGVVTISGATKVFVIIGHPIAQVRSPEYFNDYFAKKGLDAVLVPLDVHPDDVRASLAALKRVANLHGIIATVPHKATLMEATDRLTDRARLAGGVNVAKRNDDGTWTGDMLDGAGFVRGLRARRVNPKGAIVHMVGAGGVGRAIAVSLAEAGIASLNVWDLDWYRTQALTTAVSSRFPDVHVRPERGNAAQATIVINATPLGMRPEDPLPVDIDQLNPSTIACDVISKPVMSKYLLAAERRGCTVVTGKDLFEGQAIAMAEFFGWRL
jgi:shikimate dehydrogenase